MATEGIVDHMRRILWTEIEIEAALEAKRLVSATPPDHYVVSVDVETAVGPDPRMAGHFNRDSPDEAGQG